MSNPTRARLVLGVLALSIAPASHAATKTATFIVQAQVTKDCTISATTLNFGTLGVLGANTDATSTVTAICTNTTPYSLGLDAGTVATSTIAARLLGSGTATMGFQLYSDAGRAQVWGNTPGTDTVSGTGNGSAQNFTVNGRIPAQGVSPAPGSYTTTITVTVTY